MNSKTDSSSDTQYLSARQVRARYGDISDMSLYRWEHDPKLGFPAPLRINGRRFWSLASLEEFERSRAAQRGAA